MLKPAFLAVATPESGTREYALIDSDGNIILTLRTTPEDASKLAEYLGVEPLSSAAWLSLLRKEAC